MSDAALDADTRRLLDALPPGPDLTELPPAQARLAARAGIFPPDPARPVLVRDDRARMPGAADVPVRLYRPEPNPDRPAQAGPALPALLYLHGGGWLLGDLDTVDHLCRAIAHDAGCVVVSADYRLAPENPFPAGLQDAVTVLDWMAAGSAALALDPTRIAVGGDSAGGNLAAALCLHARDRSGPPIRLQLLVYPVADHRFDTASYQENGDGFLLTRAAMMTFWRNYLAGTDDGDSPYASVLRADLSGLPPALVITASHDPLRDEGEALAVRLAEAGVAVRCLRFNGTIHGFVGRFPLIAAGRAALALITDAMRAILVDVPQGWPPTLTIEHVDQSVLPTNVMAEASQAGPSVTTRPPGDEL